MVEQKQSDILTIKLRFPDSATPPQKLSRERARALKDLTQSSHFRPLSCKNAPYSIEFHIQENKLIFQMKNASQDNIPSLVLSLSPYRRIIKDYFMIIESYESMRAQSTTSKLETIDMARRGVHNEAAEMIIERLKDKIEMDLETARGFFTLICVLYIGSMKSGWI